MFKNRLVKIVLLFLIFFLCGSLLAGWRKRAEIESRVAEKEAKLEKIRIENERIKKELSEVKTPEYIEKQYRDKLGLSRSGEIVVILPPPEILSKLVPKFENEEDILPDPNWKKWLNVFGFD